MAEHPACTGEEAVRFRCGPPCFPAAAGTHRVLTNTVSSLVVPSSERERAMGSRATDRIQTVGIPDQQPIFSGGGVAAPSFLAGSTGERSSQPCRRVRYPHPRLLRVSIVQRPGHPIVDRKTRVRFPLGAPLTRELRVCEADSRLQPGQLVVRLHHACPFHPRPSKGVANVPRQTAPTKRLQAFRFDAPAF